MSKYFVKYDSGTKCKNTADKEAETYARSLDGILLNSVSAKTDFIKEVRHQIELINLRNRRCKDVRFSTWNGEGTNIGISEGICYLRIYKVNKEVQ